MKTTIKILFFFLLTGLIISGCKKDNNDAMSEEEIAEEVADDIAALIGSGNSGLSAEIADVAEIAEENLPDTSKIVKSDTLYVVDTTIVRTNPSGAVITYNYTYQMQYGYLFDGGKLTGFFYDGEADGNFDAPRIASSSNSVSDWLLGNFEIGSSYYILNGTSSITSSTESKVRNKVKIKSNSQITVSNVKIDKSTFQILEGSLNLNISGTVDDQDFSYNVTIIYYGNGKAELTINGNTYIINISTGEIE